MISIITCLYHCVFPEDYSNTYPHSPLYFQEQKLLQVRYGMELQDLFTAFSDVRMSSLELR